ncbi:MAG: molybdopterin biosynthesis protein [SAR202 cluster bacterium]|nr:molybdopterin biosynthesis protein [Chloroflexota bacterium]MQG39903.1 molybdopterin biosynthesis protein [SAR202 cluster bacterium]|tara:strand:+ start:3366 stop:5297 length:1932 start_codon:yes stop_codon:yes gene_type:complete
MKPRKRNQDYYLNDIPLEDAIESYFKTLSKKKSLSQKKKLIRINESLAKITAEAVWAVNSSPNYDSSAMDGFAVKAKETVSATETNPIYLNIGTQAIQVDTGDPVPIGFDAVIMIEHTSKTINDEIEIRQPVPPYNHIRKIGEDIVATELVLPQNHKIRPQDIAACAAAGITNISVHIPPKVLIIPTGDEIIPIGAKRIRKEQIVDTNSIMLGSMMTEFGASPTLHPPIPDDEKKLKSTIKENIRGFDIILINAGSSAGRDDYTSSIIDNLGEVIVHGIAIKPGHPVVLGIINEKPVIGIPGYPVSAALTTQLIVKPIINKKLGLIESQEKIITATTTKKIASSIGEDEFIRVNVGKIDGKFIVCPTQQGAGVLMSLVKSDGFLKIPRLTEGIESGTTVNVILFNNDNDITKSIFLAGSHDPSIDLIISKLYANHGIRLISSNIGSIGGLMALKRKESHIAGSHLLDEKTGGYNIPHINRFLPGQKFILINLAYRSQGLIVKKGNPKHIKSISDISKPNVEFVNRQLGSGTRILFDYELKSKGINSKSIKGYQRQEITHLGVAATVESGLADVGLGLLSASKAFDLDFIPVTQEKFDLVIPEDYYGSVFLEPLINLIKSDEYKQDIIGLGGYDTKDTGETTYI